MEPASFEAGSVVCRHVALVPLDGNGFHLMDCHETFGNSHGP